MGSVTSDSSSVCARCGFQAERLTPSDAGVAARSLARRWRELHHAVSEHRDAALLLRHSLAGGGTIGDRIRQVAEVFEQTAADLGHIWTRERPVLDSASSVGPTVDDADQLTALAAAGERLSAVIARYSADQWTRIGQRRGVDITALDLLREAIHMGSHELRVCRDELSALSGHTLEDQENRR